MAEGRGGARYQEIEGWLRERVHQGVPGDALPSEADLATQFGVSRMTARQAVQNLAAEGMVQRRRGAGTFIAERPLHRHTGPLMNFTADMRRRGKTASSDLLDARLRAATAADVEALRLEPGARVVSLSRLRRADGVPMAIEHAAMPAQCAPVLAMDLEAGSLHEALRGMGHEPAIALTWITARTATSAEAKLLDIAPRSALLVERRIISDTDDTPIEHTETVYAAERYVIDAVFSLTSPGPPSVPAADAPGARPAD